jgi:hypothetical protein
MKISAAMSGSKLTWDMNWITFAAGYLLDGLGESVGHRHLERLAGALHVLVLAVLDQRPFKGRVDAVLKPRWAPARSVPVPMRCSQRLSH